MSDVKVYFLLACPFCGRPGEIENYKFDGRSFFSIGCRSSGCCGNGHQLGEALPAARMGERVVAWNCRSPVWTPAQDVDSSKGGGQ